MREPLFIFAAVVLRFEETDAGFVIAAEPFAEAFERVVLAPERGYQHAARVRMLHERGQQIRGHFMVAAELRAAVRVREGAAARSVLPLEISREVFGELVHAADRRDDPEVVADSDRAVGAAVAEKGAPFFRLRQRRGRQRAVGVFEFAREVRPEVMGVNEAPGRNVGCRVPDRHVVFDDRFACPDRTEGEFVSAPDRFPERDRRAVDGRTLPGGEVGKRDGDVVGPPDLQIAREFAHVTPPAAV